MKKVFTAVALILIGILGLFILKKVESEKNQTQNKQPQKPTPVVKVITPNEEIIPIFYTANATLQAKTSATLKPQVSGRVIKLFVEEGSFVKAGQSLAMIEPDKEDYQIESQMAVINQLESSYLNKKAIYERRKQLYEKELIAKEELDNAKTDMEVALNQLNSAKAVLKEYQRQKRETLIKAPFDGFLDKRMINIGDYVDTQTQAFYILKLNPLWAVFQLPQQYVKNIKVGDVIDIDIDGIGTVKGKIDYISSSLNENNLLVVRALIENKDGKLRENMYGKAKIIIDKKKGYKLPEEVVQLMGNDSFIYIVSPEFKAKKVLVNVLYQEPGYVYITADLKPDDKVIVSNLMNVKEGMQVKVIPEVKQ
ncbi:MAG: efflux RND transporter periplasmic adaptor subunit [Hydrogenothermaceae bacterium]